MGETINVYKWRHNIVIELLRSLLFKVHINEKYTSNMMELFNTFNIQVEIVSRYFNLFWKESDWNKIIQYYIYI